MRSVKYFLQLEAGLHGAQNISFPLGVALNYLAAANETPTEGYSSLVQSIHEATKTPAGSWIGGFLIGLQRNSVPETVQTVVDGYFGIRARARTWYGPNPTQQSPQIQEQVPNAWISPKDTCL